MKVFTDLAILNLIAIAAHFDRGARSRVERGEVSAMRILLTSIVRSTVDLGRGGFSAVGGFSSVVVGGLPKELTLDFGKWARHGTCEVLVLW